MGYNKDGVIVGTSENGGQLAENNNSEIGQGMGMENNNTSQIDSGAEIVPETSIAMKNKPKLIISNYTLSSEMVQAGDEFKLDLVFYNTNSQKAVRNIKITLNGQEQSQTATGQPTSGSVFTPVNSSNTFYIPFIAAGSTAAKSITLKTVPTAAAQNYTIQATFEYEDMDGNEFTATETIGVPVVQKTEILFGEFEVQGAQIGMDLPIEFEFYNVGKDNLSRFMINIEGEGFSKVSSRYFVGNFAAGQSDRYSTTIVPIASGKIKGNVIVTFEDSTGKSHEHKLPFETEVMEGFEPDNSEVIEPENGMIIDPENGMPNEGNGIVGYLPHIGIGFTLLLLLVIFLYRRKKKKKESQELLIDEE